MDRDHLSSCPPDSTIAFNAQYNPQTRASVSCLPIHTFSVALGVLILEKAEEIRVQMIDLVL